MTTIAELPEIDQLRDTLTPPERRVVNEAEVVDIEIRDISGANAARTAFQLCGEEVALELGKSKRDVLELGGRIAGAALEIEKEMHSRKIRVSKPMAEVLLEAMKRAGERFANTDVPGGYYASVSRFLIKDMYDPKKSSSGMHVNAGRPVIVF